MRSIPSGQDIIPARRGLRETRDGSHRNLQTPLVLRRSVESARPYRARFRCPHSIVTGARSIHGPEATAGIRRIRRKPYLSTTIELARARPRGLVPDYPEPKTIEAHLGHVYRKLDVDNRTQLAR